MTREVEKDIQRNDKASLLNKEDEYYQKLVGLYDLDSCIEWIDINNFEKVCLQFPDSLLIDSVDIAAYIENKLSRKVFILGDTTYGSCCVDEIAAKHINGSCVIHFGHACLSPVNTPVFYAFNKKPLNIDRFLDTLEKNNDLQKPILLLYDVSYYHCTENLRKKVNERIGLKKAICVPDLSLKHQKLNSVSCSDWCSVTNDSDQHKYEALQRSYCPPSPGQFNSIVYLGTASPNLYNFMYMFTGCKTFYYNDNCEDLKELCLACMLKQLSYLTERLKNARTVGIVVATLGIEGYKEAVDHARKLCVQNGKRVYVISVGKPSPTKLANFSEVDIFVVISCPETDFGDKKEYFCPLVGLYELELALNTARPWGVGYTRDFRDVIRGGKQYVEASPTNNDAYPPSLDDSSLSDHSSMHIIPHSILYQLVQNPDEDNKWKGLNQRLGEDKPTKLTKGRKGGPQSSYNTEPKKNFKNKK